MGGGIGTWMSICHRGGVRIWVMRSVACLGVVSRILTSTGFHALERPVPRIIEIWKFELWLFDQGVADGQILQAGIFTGRLQVEFSIFERIVRDEMVLHVSNSYSHSFLE